MRISLNRKCGRAYFWPGKRSYVFAFFPRRNVKCSIYAAEATTEPLACITHCFCTRDGFWTLAKSTVQITQLLFEKSQLLYFLWYEKTDEELRANFKSRFEVTKGGCKKKKKYRQGPGFCAELQETCFSDDYEFHLREGPSWLKLLCLWLGCAWSDSINQGRIRDSFPYQILRLMTSRPPAQAESITQSRSKSQAVLHVGLKQQEVSPSDVTYNSTDNSRKAPETSS